MVGTQRERPGSRTEFKNQLRILFATLRAEAEGQVHSRLTPQPPHSTATFSDTNPLQSCGMKINKPASSEDLTRAGRSLRLSRS